MTDFVMGALVYFGSLLLPLVLIALRSVRRRWRALLVVVLVHVALIVAAGVAISTIRASGNRDWLFALYYYVVVNVLAAVGYLCFAAYVVWDATDPGNRTGSGGRT
jgi:hypothetical protein